jgi:hypothetical protein
MSTIEAYAFLASGGNTARTIPARLSDIVNVKEMGATGDGSTDDRAAIQSAFDLAFGTVASPNGNAGRFLNRPVFFPSGNYKVGGPLYLVNVYGAHIFGESMRSTRLSYSGSYSGNTQATATGGANAITPLIMTNGLSFSRIERMNLSMTDNNSACIYLYQDGTKGQTNQNTFSEVLVESATAGFLVGYQSNALCSETAFFQCNAQSCTYGLRNISQNALDNWAYGFGAASCGTGVSVPTGSVNLIGGSFSGNTIDVETGADPMTIIGARTESAQFVLCGNDTAVTIIGCLQTAGGAGYFADAGSLNRVIIDGCEQTGSTSTFGKILGSGSSKVYLRANRFANASYLASFTGTVAQNI